MKTVIFLGKRDAPGSPTALFPGAELWGITGSQQKYGDLGFIEDWTEWFDLHPVERTPFYEGIINRSPDTWEWYKSLPATGRPVWLLEKDPRVPASQSFPWRQLSWQFEIHGETIMATCQVDWMFMRALDLGFEHIVLAGHGISRDPLHMISHRGIMYWVGFARGRGVKVTILEPSWYRTPKLLYGIEDGGLSRKLKKWRIRSPALLECLNDL